MTELQDKRSLYAKDAMHETNGDKYAAFKIAEKNYRQFIGRELSFGEVQELGNLINNVKKDNIETYANKYRKLTGG